MDVPPHVFAIEDSLNDRDDPESSMAKSKTTSGLPQVLEAQEHQEVATIDMEEGKRQLLDKTNDKGGRQRYMTEPNLNCPSIEAIHE